MSVITDRTPSLDESGPGPGPDENAYELALDRMQQARRRWSHARREAERMVRAADDEFYAAETELAACERSPGIPRDM
jgi:hypothetical protein